MRYTLIAGEEPTDQWHVSLALPLGPATCAAEPPTGQALSGLDMVADLAAFAERLRGREEIGVRGEVIADEQHATVWPAALTRGLVHLYRTCPRG